MRHYYCFFVKLAGSSSYCAHINRIHFQWSHVHFLDCRAPIYTEDDKALSATITKIVVDEAKVSSAGVLVRNITSGQH
jgi:hypothetical protein